VSTCWITSLAMGAGWSGSPRHVALWGQCPLWPGAEGERDALRVAGHAALFALEDAAVPVERRVALAQHLRTDALADRQPGDGR